MDARSGSGLDMREWWLDGFSADRERSVVDPATGFAAYRRRKPADRLLDIVETGDGAFAVLNGSVFDAWSAQAAGSASGLPELRAWFQAMTDAVLEADKLYRLDARDFRAPVEPPGALVRLLGPEDAAAFADLDAACSADDLDAGYVELDHDLVFGAFSGGALMAKASAYPFLAGDEEDGAVWDIGYVTRPGARGSGWGKACAAGLARAILDRGRVPLIRAADSRPASQGIALALGFRPCGTWYSPEAGD